MDPRVVCAVVASGLQMRFYVDQAKAGRSNVPNVRVELRNAGDSDLVLNLGTLTSGSISRRVSAHVRAVTRAPK